MIPDPPPLTIILRTAAVATLIRVLRRHRIALANLNQRVTALENPPP